MKRFLFLILAALLIVGPVVTPALALFVNSDIRSPTINRVVADLATLKATSGGSTIKAVHLLGGINEGDGREGEFRWLAGDQSANPGVLVDTSEGVFVKLTVPGDGSTGVWVRNYKVLYLEYFGAVGDWDGATGTDDFTAIDGGFGFAQFLGTTIRGQAKRYRFTQPLTIDSKMGFKGAFLGVQNIGDTDGTILTKDGNFIGLEVTNSAGPTFEDWAMEGTGGPDISTGIKLTQTGRMKMHRVAVVSMGDDGIEFNNGNLSDFRDIYVLGNGGDGLFVNGDPTPDTNACLFDNIDARGNSGDGVNFDNAWNVFGGRVSAQQNGGIGVRINNVRQSTIGIYSEANTGNDIELTSHVNNEGNVINALFFETLVDNSAGQNMIVLSKQGSDTWAMFERMYAKAWEIPNTTIVGGFELKHDVAARFDFYADKTGQKQTIRWRNVADLADRDNDDPIHQLVHELNGAVISRSRRIFSEGDTSPDLGLSEFWLANNAGATVIDQFSGGVEGQIVTILSNNANTTIQHSAVAPGIRLKSGVDFAMTLNDSVVLLRNGTGFWVEI